jgi:hypothetical protein
VEVSASGYPELNNIFVAVTQMGVNSNLETKPTAIHIREGALFEFLSLFLLCEFCVI